MYQINENQGTLHITCSSEMTLVDRAVSACREFLGQFGVTHFADANVVLRELLINGIEHGNQKDRSRTVVLIVAHLGGPRFQFSVEDHGQGFDHKSMDFSMPKAGEKRSRGLPLVHGLADELEFNEAGNKVTAFLTIINPTGFAVEIIEGWTVIQPTGDLTAACADEFRQTLLRELDSGNRKYKIDLVKVTDLDSVSLSVLVAFAALLREGGDYAIELCNALPDLRNLFKMTRVSQDFSITVAGN
jgi:anti-anti-sigma factor